MSEEPRCAVLRCQDDGTHVITLGSEWRKWERTVCDEHANRMRAEPYRFNATEGIFYMANDLNAEDWNIVSDVSVSVSNDMFINLPGVSAHQTVISLKRANANGESLPDLKLLIPPGVHERAVQMLDRVPEEEEGDEAPTIERFS